MKQIWIIEINVNANAYTTLEKHNVELRWHQKQETNIGNE